MRTSIAVVLMGVASSAFAYRNSAWIPPWDANALTSIQQNLGVLSESNPVWYSLNADGSIAKNWNAENPTWRAAMTGTQLLPTIQNAINGQFDGSVIASLIAVPASAAAHADAIAQLAVANAYDGVDIDYESIPTASRADFTAFVSLLAGKLHAAGKQLSVTVYAKSSDAENWTGPGAEDWQAIGRIADWVKVMAYDYSWSGSAAGPIAPLDWIDSVATYAESTIPDSKLIIGLPWYGYDWIGSSGTPVSWATAIQTAQTNGATIGRDANDEATFSYAGHTVFFQDAASYQKKVNLLIGKHPRIAGFAAWAAGVEDPQIWNVIKSTGSSVPASPPPTGTIRRRAVH